MWKHKTKWLVRGGRKVRCYLCGKKILAKGDLFFFHGDTGYYSHQSCLVESTTISGNERRRAVKKIAVGAAVVGAIAAGAGKFLDVSSQSKNSPDTQTILTSQGLILPALTSDPANPVAGQMWYRSDKGVTAHFDAIENRVIYSNRIVDGSAVVTSKGIVNGLSVLLNDGQDWGPDTTSGATAPGQYGSPYTKSTGIGDAINYALANPYKDANGSPIPQKVHILSGALYIYDPITVQSSTSYVSLLITGDSSTQTWIYSAHNSGYTITINPSNFANANIEFDNMAPAPMSGYTPEGFLYMDFTTTNNGSNIFQSYNFDVAGRGYSDNSVYATGLESIFLYNFEDYGENDTFGISNNVETGGIYWYGGYVPYTLTFIGTGTLSADNPMKLYMSANGFISTLNIGNFNTAVFEQVYFSSNGGINLTGDINSIVFIGGNLQCAIILDSSLSTPPTVNSLYVLGTQLYLTNNFTVNHNVTLTYWDLKWGSVVTNGFTFSPGSPSPTISVNPPISGTAYQNTNMYAIRLKIPVTYSPTSTAAATMATGISSTSTVTTSTKVSIPAGVTAGEILTYEMVVPAGQYYEIVVTNATIGTVEVQAA